MLCRATLAEARLLEMKEGGVETVRVGGYRREDGFKS